MIRNSQQIEGPIPYSFDGPSIRGSFTATIGTETVSSQIYDGEFPEEYMQRVKSLVGDGKAKISISTEMSMKDFGTGASAMCTITLTCDQSESAIEEAAQLAGGMARHYATQMREMAERDLGEAVAARKLQR